MRSEAEVKHAIRQLVEASRGGAYEQHIECTVLIDILFWVIGAQSTMFEQLVLDHCRSAKRSAEN